MYKPRVQIYFDWVVSLLALGALLIRLDIINMNKHPVFLKNFNDIFGKSSPLILVMYFLKPILIWIVAKCKGMTNQSYYA